MLILGYRHTSGRAKKLIPRNDMGIDDSIKLRLPYVTLPGVIGNLKKKKLEASFQLKQKYDL